MNLFHHERVEQYFGELMEYLRVEIDGLNISNVDIEKKAHELAEKYEIEVPSINKNGITSILNLEDSNEHVYQEHPNAMYGRPDVVATATFTVPITGTERYFGLLPSTFSQKTYPALISRGELKFKVRTGYVRLELPDQWKEHIRRTSQDIVEFIEVSLRNLAADFQKYNSNLLPQITEVLNRKKQEWERKQQLDKDINPFN